MVSQELLRPPRQMTTRFRSTDKAQGSRFPMLTQEDPRSGLAVPAVPFRTITSRLRCIASYKPGPTIVWPHTALLDEETLLGADQVFSLTRKVSKPGWRSWEPAIILSATRCMEGPFACLLLFQGLDGRSRFDFHSESGYFVGGDIEEQTIVNGGIGVNQPITHARDPSPRDIGM